MAGYGVGGDFGCLCLFHSKMDGTSHKTRGIKMRVIVMEYLPYQGKGNFRTPSPDGGVATATGLPYKDRVYPYGEALCSPCPGSCLGAADVAFEPTPWTDHATGLRYCERGQGPPKG